MPPVVIPRARESRESVSTWVLVVEVVVLGTWSVTRLSRWLVMSQVENQQQMEGTSRTAVAAMLSNMEDEDWKSGTVR